MFVAAKFSDSGVADGKLQRLPIPPAFFSPVKIASLPLAWAAALVVSVSNLPLHAAESAGAADREYAVSVVTRVAGPVLEAAAARELKQRLPINDWEKDRAAVTHLEAVGRTLVGVAPWMELPPDDTPEGQLRARMTAQAVRTIANITDPASPDFANFSRGSQPLVDAAFLAHALLRAPTRLWGALSPTEQANVIAAFKATRGIKPGENNWLLFAATVEAALWQFTGEYRRESITYALERHEQWYVGDGTYGDGREFHWDYYNSFVIQPMMMAVLDVCAAQKDPLAEMLPKVMARARRYAAVQEMQISPEGTFPVIGRSSAYRMGAFQHLADMSLRRELPPTLNAGAVRGALTAITRRMIEAPGTFDAKGWLNIGVAGHQPSIRERYIATGSLYLCMAGLLHLGLPANDPFWTAPAAKWTQARVWSGEDMPADSAYREPARKL